MLPMILGNPARAENKRQSVMFCSTWTMIDVLIDEILPFWSVYLFCLCMMLVGYRICQSSKDERLLKRSCDTHIGNETPPNTNTAVGRIYGPCIRTRTVAKMRSVKTHEQSNAEIQTRARSHGNSSNHPSERIDQMEAGGHWLLFSLRIPHAERFAVKGY